MRNKMPPLKYLPPPPLQYHRRSYTHKIVFYPMHLKSTFAVSRLLICVTGDIRSNSIAAADHIKLVIPQDLNPKNNITALE
jgi:hypothetical protein